MRFFSASMIRTWRTDIRICDDVALQQYANGNRKNAALAAIALKRRYEAKNEKGKLSRHPIYVFTCRDQKIRR